MEPSSDDNYTSGTRSIVDLFDSICFSRGEEDAIICLGNNDTGVAQEEAICFLELQELSKALACQLAYRYGVPDYVLIDCLGHVAAEAVAVLACMRIGKPFVPVSVLDQHVGGRLTVLANELRNSNRNSSYPTTSPSSASLVAICCCENDQDPALGVFYAAGIYNILYCDRTGNLREQLRVPSSLPDSVMQQTGNDKADDLYILFTSGTTSGAAAPVVGSHTSTLRRLQWFHATFPASPRIARRTRLTFVDGITELLTPLTSTQHNNASSTRSILVAVEPKQLQQQGIGILLDLMKPTQITLLPSQLDMLLSTTQLLSSASSSLERIIISGEVCSVSTWNKFQQAVTQQQCRHVSTINHINNNSNNKMMMVELINLYGQTETTGDVTCAVLTDMPEQAVVVNGVVAVGKPILPDDIHITQVVATKAATAATADTTISSNGNEKQGVIVEETMGEIFISGNNLSNGYLGGQKPFTSFATGDIGFCQDDGIWYVKGRCDDVEKINGILTSPFEAETAFWQFYNKEMKNNHQVAATIVDGSLYMICEGGPPNTTNTTPIFSRLAMNQAGYPWNLIPKRVFFHQTIPRNSTGAGKVNRSSLKELVRGLICKADKDKQGDDAIEPLTTAATTNPALNVDSILVNVLQLSDSCMVDDQKSFVELGGDSASAVHFLYQLRCSAAQNNEIPKTNNNFLLHQLTAVDILMTDSISELKAIIASGGGGGSSKSRNDDDEDPDTTSKRPRLDNAGNRQSRHLPEFSPLPVEFFHDGPNTDEDAQLFFHCAVKFAACVDSGPRKSTDDDDGMFYCACQGGVIQKISATSGNVVACRHFSGWMFQADCLPMQQTVLAFGHSRHDRGGLVVALSLDLLTIIWQRELDFDVGGGGGGGVTCTPVILKRRGDLSDRELWVTTDKRLHVLDIDTGRSRACLDFPEAFHSMPTFDVLRETVLFAGSNLFKVSVADKEAMNEICGCSTRAPIAHDDKKVLCGQVAESNLSIGHVHKDLLRLSDSHTLIADSWGSIHLLSTRSMVGMSLKVSNYPLTSPTELSESPPPPPRSSSSISSIVVVGAYDGTVTYLSLKGDTTLSKMCDFDAGATLYARPLALPDGSCVVFTTAGDVVRVKHHSISRDDDSNSDNCYTAIKQISRRRVFAEIWSDPLLLCNEASSSLSSSSTFRIAFGARDSKVHIMTV